MKKYIAGLLTGVILSGICFATTLNAETTDIKVVLNGTQLSVMPIILSGYTYLPLRAIGEALGCYVKWNEELRQVEIFVPENTESKKSSLKSDYTTPAAPNTSNVIETTIDGDFEGFEYDRIYKLSNGQIWQQTYFYTWYHYAFMPKVMIYQSDGVYKMKVDGIDKAVTVKQLK